MLHNATSIIRYHEFRFLSNVSHFFTLIFAQNICSLTRYIHENISYITRGPWYYTCEGCYYTGARYVPQTWSRERRSGRSFRCCDPARGCISEKMCRVMRRRPETTMTGERPRMRSRTTHGVGRKIGRCDFPTAEEEAAAPRYAPSRIVLLALCAVIVWRPMTVSSERDTVSIVSFCLSLSLSLSFSVSPIPRFQLAVNIDRLKNMTVIGIL